MFKKMFLVTTAFSLSLHGLNAQNALPSADLMKQHVYFLSSDSLQGRQTSSKGEKIAATYIINEFKEIGLLPKGDNNSYLQAFKYNAGKELGPANELSVAGKKYTLKTDFFPLNYSGNGKASGKSVYVKYGISMAAGRDDYHMLKSVKGKILFMQCGYPSGMDPHSEKAAAADLKTRLDTAISKGAVGVVFINTDTTTDDLKMSFEMRVKEVGIPVLFLNDKSLSPEKLFNSAVSMSSETHKVEKEANNIAGYIDNGRKYTVIIGAHYDHLGYGENGNSLYRGEPAIHNGADDNASGVAAIIELARMLKKSSLNANNYLFVAFSGEELGLYGSKSFADNPFNKIDSNHVDYMINLDMVGRLSNEDKNLIINGSGTSDVWKDILEKTQVEGVRVKTAESGVGPSDHTSFYLKDIPVLHFFTGSHADYHKPTDDADKVNYEGMVKVDDYIYRVIASADNKSKLAYIKTKEDKNENAPRFTVTLGVVPDYMFDGEGMKIDGVSDGKPAAGAGLLKGDIVVQLGDHRVTDMMSYMKALSAFHKGDETTVTFKRNGTESKAKIKF